MQTVCKTSQQFVCLIKISLNWPSLKATKHRLLVILHVVDMSIIVLYVRSLSYAERDIVYSIINSSVRPPVRPSVCLDACNSMVSSHNS